MRAEEAGGNPDTDFWIPRGLSGAMYFFLSMGTQTTPDRLTPLDTHFAHLICRLDPQGQWPLWAASALASRAVGMGHVCVDLGDFAGTENLFCTDSRAPSGSRFPGIDDWTALLGKSPTVGVPGDYRPLVLDGSRLYLHRYWDYERRLAQSILSRVAGAQECVDSAKLRDGLMRLFPGSDSPDWQRVAGAMAALKRLTVIAGGPGTGKTTTVARILALLIELSPTPPRIALAAPTGKAAARLRESIVNVLPSLPCDERTRAAVPVETHTIHRLLGAIPDSPFFRHDSRNPLPYHVVVIDEASMVDIALMGKLVDAMPVQSRLILLGDKDQLASVEAGAVLGDICDTGTSHRFSPGFVSLLSQLLPDTIDSAPCEPPVADSIVTLTRSHRFSHESGIAQFSQAVNAGDWQAAGAVVRSGKQDLSFAPLPAPEALQDSLRDMVLEHFGPSLRERDPRRALESLKRFRILCAVKDGPFGVAGINRTVEQILQAEGLIDAESFWYHGRPVMVTRNDYTVGLFNGDTGLIMREPESSSHRACFPGPDGTVRKLVPRQLPPHETVFAMTVHKSQGSEFDRILVVTPPVHVPVLTRELLYTAVTRARSGVLLWGSDSVLQTAAVARIERQSGLRNLLWGTLAH